MHTGICPTQTHCCLPGYDCVSDGCCPTGEVPCGARCYNPRTHKCCADGVATCKIGYDCVPSGCCPSGEIPCGKSKCYNPKTQTCCTGSGRVWGCGLGANCCPSPGLCSKSDEQCCEKGTCKKEETCCQYQCCTEAGYCAANGYCSPALTKTKTISFVYDASRTVQGNITAPPKAVSQRTTF